MVRATQLAEVLEVSGAAISQYEKGRHAPSADKIALMAEMLRFPPSFFFGPERRARTHTAFFRSLRRDTKAAKRAAWWRLQWQADLAEYFSSYIDLPELVLPETRLKSNPVTLSEDDIELAALELRDSWGIGRGAISNVTMLAEKNGIRISRYRLHIRDEDAVSEASIGDQWDCVLLNADKDGAVRTRFSLAHELGHLVLHRNVTESERHEHHKEFERQANYFAGAFLLPKATFLGDFDRPTLDAFIHMKQKWKVSVAAMVMRAAALGRLSKSEVGRLFSRINYRGWNVAEPYDDIIEPENPQLFRQCIDTLIDSGTQTKEDITAAVRLIRKDVEEICSLEYGDLSSNA